MNWFLLLCDVFLFVFWKKLKNQITVLYQTDYDTPARARDFCKL